jgi:alpha-D-ribose 1-methylphosphonate 5-triphosphate synthase subunit PhnL
MTSQIEFNILWLDELESEMDALGCQQLINIIEDKSDIIETLFWITNAQMVKENIQNKIICVKKCGKTEVYEA